MTTPQSTAPSPRGRYDRTPAEIEARLKRLEAKGRRCDGNSRRCHNNAAVAELTVVKLDPTTGEETGEPYKVKSCARHRIIWEKGISLYKVLSVKRLSNR